ncbi:MAG: DUF2235 domain-containing protein [Thiohalobacteraceae bacterium]
MKRIVICCDGTWNRADQHHNGEPCPTNVVKIGYRIAKRDGAIPQIVYYDQGVGTGNILDRYSGGALGEGLEDNVYDAYRFLIANYEPGDELYFFGFSRGAFTVRSVVGMVRKCGVLNAASVRRYREAIELYRSEHHPTDALPIRFRGECSVVGDDKINVKFIGVWDTVGALGIPLRGLRSLTRAKYQFHDTELSGTVENAYHALAIDEHRAPFEPTLWAYKPKPGQTIEQVWFCGAHSDVGGGYPESGLSDIALDWMLGKAGKTGLRFADDAVKAYPLAPDPGGTLHDSKTGLYRMTAGIERPIGGAAPDPQTPPGSADAKRPVDPTQAVHTSVLERWDRDAEYRPAALRDYFERIGDVRARA